MSQERLLKQIDFLKELEKLKLIYRQNGVLDQSRSENSAEHSWHVALMAMVLHEHTAVKNIDLLRVIKMLLVHDVVEIDAGDTLLYDVEGNREKSKKEILAAHRIFGLLPEDQRNDFIELWGEFEAGETPDALFASSLDGLQPLMNHLMTGGNALKEQLEASQVLEKKKYIHDVAPILWDYAKDVIKESKEKGLYI